MNALARLRPLSVVLGLWESLGAGGYKYLARSVIFFFKLFNLATTTNASSGIASPSLCEAGSSLCVTQKGAE